MQQDMPYVCFMNLHDTHDLGDRHWTSDEGLHIHTSTPQPCDNATVIIGWMLTKSEMNGITAEYSRVVSHSWNPHKVYSIVVVRHHEQRNTLQLNSWEPMGDVRQSRLLAWCLLLQHSTV